MNCIIRKLLTLTLAAVVCLAAAAQARADAPAVTGLEIQKYTISEASMDSVLIWAREALLIAEDYDVSGIMTREDFAEILWNMNCCPRVGTEPGGFEEWAAVSQLFGGEDGTCELEGEMTRDEVISVLWRTEGGPRPEEGFLCYIPDMEEDYIISDCWAAERHLLLRTEQYDYKGSELCPALDALRYIYYLYHYRDPFPITKEELVASAAAVMEHARVSGYRYGDSKSSPPTADGLISCERLVCKALWDLGEDYRDQAPGGGYLGIKADWYRSYLEDHGFVRSQDIKDMGYGSIVEVRNGFGDFHTFICVSYDPATGYMERYDAGADSYIRTQQPISGPFPYTFIRCWNIPEN